MFIGKHFLYLEVSVGVVALLRSKLLSSYVYFTLDEKMEHPH